MMIAARDEGLRPKEVIMQNAPDDQPTQTQSSEEITPVESADAAANPLRNPVEKLFVRGLILVGLVVVVVEARAKIGYDMTRSQLSRKINEIDEEIDESGEDRNDVNYETISAYLKFRPRIEAAQPEGLLRKSRWIQWFSFAKPDSYRLKLFFGDDETFLFYETSDPPPEPEPERAIDEEHHEEMEFGPGPGRVGPEEMATLEEWLLLRKC